VPRVPPPLAEHEAGAELEAWRGWPRGAWKGGNDRRATVYGTVALCLVTGTLKVP